MKTVEVNRAPVRIRPSGRTGDSGRDTFTKKKNKQMKSKQKELNEHPGKRFGSANRVGPERGVTLKWYQSIPDPIRVGLGRSATKDPYYFNFQIIKIHLSS